MAHKDANELMLAVLGTLNEAQARWYVAREALAQGRGGLKRLHEVTGMSRPTILKGIRELQQGKPLEPTTRIRRPGGGGRRLEEADPRFARALERLMEENTAGDPMSLLRWTNKSTARIAAELTRQGHRASDETVRRRPRELGYSLQANVKTLEGSSPPERDAQFRYLNAQVRKFLARGEPVLSVDTKKKERVGAFKNPGRTWRPQGTPQAVNMYDYPTLGMDTAIPYGAYDVQRDEGFVNVGTSHDTPRSSPSRACAGGGACLGGHYPRRGRCSCAPMAGAAMAAGIAPGSTTCNTSRTSWGCGSRSATTRLARASGTRSSTACSPSSA